MTRKSGVLAPFALLALVACGGDGGTTPPPPPPAQVLGSIVATPTTLTLAAGQSQTLTVVALDVNNAAILSATGYGFSSTNTAVAAVSTGGRVTALSSGTATINVSLTREGVTKTAAVTVNASGTLPTTATVAAGNLTNDFTPALVVIQRTGTITYTFGATLHNVAFGGAGGAPADIGNSSNTTVARTFNTAGSFAYTCTLHSGMNGSVLVP